MEQHMTKSRLKANGEAIEHDAIDERANVMEHDAAKIVPVRARGPRNRRRRKRRRR
jgi:hypothetical protein